MPDDNNACSDGDPCTFNDRCMAGACLGTAHPCLPCETCDGAGGCKLAPGHCLIGGSCFAEGDADPAGPCRECRPQENPAGFTADDTNECSDGDSCTYGDRCMGGTCIGTSYTCKSCEDCTGTGDCELKTNSCLIEGKCFAQGDINPTNPCQACHPSESQSAFVNDDTLPCSDGEACTKADHCREGQCLGTDYSGECDLECEWCMGDGTCGIEDGWCKIDGACRYDGVTPPGNPCLTCQWEVERYQWVPANGVPCDDQNKCTVNDTCADGACAGQLSLQCPPPAGPCVLAECNPSTGLCEDLPIEDGTSCDDDVLCTYEDKCVSGVCVGVIRTCEEPNPDCDGKGGCRCGTGKLRCDGTTADHCGEDGKGNPACLCGTEPACTNGLWCKNKGGEGWHCLPP